MQPLSHLVQSIEPSPTAMMMAHAKQLQAAGRDIVNLAGGEPDFDTPQHIQAAAFEAIRRGDTHYPISHGQPELLDAIVGKMQRENSVAVARENLLVTPGAKWALYAGLAAVLNPGDEVLVLEPAWVSYVPMVQLHGAVPVAVSLDAPDDFRITADGLRAHVTERTKLIMVTTPNNPTGRVLTADEADAIVEVALEHDLYVLSDEIYEHIIFDGMTHISLAALPGMAERTLTVNGMSKGYAMTGWRLGWLAAPAAITKLARTYQTQSVTCAASFTQTAAVAALNGPQACVREMTDAYDARRRFVLDAFEEIPGVDCPPVQGAFYVFPRFPQAIANGLDSLTIGSRLLDETGIAGTPGSAFGRAGEGHIRFSIATAMGELEKMVERLAKFVPTL